ncbi:MAG: FAD:protein FMN transferase, partial [Planctomycetota bacterium]
MKRLAEIAAVSVIGVAAIVWMNLPSDAEVAGRPVGDPSILLGETMGTTYRVVVPGVTDPALSAQLKEGIDTRLEGINSLMSTWRPDSEISRFNASEAVDHPIPISQETFGVVAAADLIKRFTGGAFDVSVAPVVSLWSFGPDRRPRAVPTDDAIAAARELVGDVGISIVPGEFGLTKTAPGSAIDLSAIAKGYGVDAIAETLRDLGAAEYLVEIGGDLIAAGRNPDDKPWRIAIERPDPSTREIQRLVDVSGFGMATSGDYRNYFEQDGVRYAHIIDPRTGLPINH